MEASPEKRLEYKNQIQEIAKDNLVYIDESGIEKSICKEKGWGIKGKALRAKKSGKYSKTY